MRIGGVLRRQLRKPPLVDRAVERPQRQPQVRGRVRRELMRRVRVDNRVVRVEMQRHAAVGQQLEPRHVDRAAPADVAGVDLFLHPLIRVGSVRNHRVVAVRARRRRTQPHHARRGRGNVGVEEAPLLERVQDRDPEGRVVRVVVAVADRVGNVVYARRRRRAAEAPGRPVQGEARRQARRRMAERRIAARARRQRLLDRLPGREDKIVDFRLARRTVCRHRDLDRIPDRRRAVGEREREPDHRLDRRTRRRPDRLRRSQTAECARA